jgi:hypothetical protein
VSQILKQGPKAWADKMNITAEQAQNTTVYFIDEDQRPAKTNLFDFVMESAELTTSPQGVATKLHIRENDEAGAVEMWTWGPNGNHPRYLETFESIEEAETELFRRTYLYDFVSEPSRDIMYFASKEECIDEIVQRLMCEHDISEETARSLYKHLETADMIRAERKRLYEQKYKEMRERQNQVAEIYAANIDYVAGETYQQTAARLSAELEERIESYVFHKAVKLIRNRANQHQESQVK